ncbi:flagellar filament capping protein FliD [Endozoicomonas sp. GU-1]|uniref:flagellar filament capping protein FliD n=1 Tax=Endozoicomonas sp. GU-1 TaxID=3009078 RepID=UPI0022B44E41|nr:flagellar filament capping protein FliD [Endozoicomonas sp. GU-1]WBA82481.1 flagellar filament capping protein FliD [Endozoicomonas sp. GU-1]WBA85414.1 flagellar filament capping protein FliD [Endozoicomonas sp. GU-1]
MNTVAPLQGGFDLGTVVDAVVNADMAPSENALKRRENQLSREQDLMVSVYQAVSNLQHSARALVQEASLNSHHVNGNGHSLGRWVAVSSESDRVGVSVRGRPDPGSYQLSVHQLASPQIMTSPPFARDTTFKDAGTLDLALNGGHWTVNIVANSTLATIARSIQLSTQGKVRATVINGKAGQQLLLTGAEKGADLRMTLSGTGTGDQLAAIMSEQAAPADAVVSINGVTLSLPGNVNQPAINGLSLTLKQADPDRQLYIEVSQDVEALVSAMSEFVNHCNNLLQASDPRDNQGLQIDAGTPASLRGISSQLRKLVNATPADTGLSSSEQITSLLDLGVSTERNGLWSLDEAWFRHQLNAMPYPVLQFLSDRDKPVLALAQKMDTLLSGSGPLISRISYLSRDLQRLASDQYALETRRQLLHQRTNQQFLNMEQTVQRMNRNLAYVDTI